MISINILTTTTKTPMSPLLLLTNHKPPTHLPLVQAARGPILSQISSVCDRISGENFTAFRETDMSYNDLIAGDPPYEDPSDSVQEHSTLTSERQGAVDHEFLKTGKSGKSKGPGVLITHVENYKFQCSGFSDRITQTTLCYVCSEKARTGCNARARVLVTLVRSEVEGEPDREEYSLIYVDPIEAHFHFHEPI